ncbi:MAG TPA: RNA 2',3'-cyclic phosphodiesterase [Burkholderiaceae bacterium]|nr:RNA 2',3'-cyclic phosphodiesterase [Burkholderiaceae bacterium]
MSPALASSAPAREPRLFIALWPTPAVRTALRERRDAIAWPRRASVVADDRLHLTLHFIGAVPRVLWPRLLPALQQPCPRIELELETAQLWRHGLVVVPARSAPEPLQALHAALAGALTDLGLPVERRAFRPHVTLARRADGAVLPPPAAPLRWRVHGYVLVDSDPVDGYRVLARYGPRGVTLATVPRTATARSRPAPAPTAR